MVHDEPGDISTEVNPGPFSNSHEHEHDAKRRKLRQQGSTASAHTFVAREPASLRKARSLVAGDVKVEYQPSVVTSAERSKVPPITVPNIQPRDAALVRLRTLLARETKQRADDTRLMIMAQKSTSLMFDNGLRLEMVEWLLSVRSLFCTTAFPLTIILGQGPPRTSVQAPSCSSPFVVRDTAPRHLDFRSLCNPLDGL
jgi:hypothetical protein